MIKDEPVKYSSLYEKYGGEVTVIKLVDYFYDELILKDPLVCDFFTKVDMNQQKKKQAFFVTYALGGVPKYTGKNLSTHHKGKGIKSEHFDTVICHLMTTLRVHGFDPVDINQVGAKLASLKTNIV